jgi:CCR4-NOT transcription complex subunit 1
MASLRVEWGVLQREVCQALAISFVAPHPNSSVVLRSVWPQNAEMIMRAMVSLFEQDKNEISRVLDVCEELRVLDIVLDSTPLAFAIELATVAARNTLLNLEQWLQRRVGYHRLPFLGVSA